MTRRSRSLALGGAAVAAAVAAAAALHPVDVLEVENAARARMVRFAVGSDEPFSVTYHHSMYDAPVTEEFVIGASGDIVLEAVSSPSVAVREYFGITAQGERHAIVRAMPELVFRVAAGAPQRLRVGGYERSFLDLGERGDRLVLRAAHRPAAAGWLEALARTGPRD